MKINKQEKENWASRFKYTVTKQDKICIVSIALISEAHHEVMVSIYNFLLPPVFQVPFDLIQVAGLFTWWEDTNLNSCPMSP